MLTKSQLKPLFDLIKEANSTAIGDGCKAPCVIADGSLLQRAATLIAQLEQDLEQCVATAAVGEDETSPYVLSAQAQSVAGGIEVDLPALVSESEDGAYVQTWMWVSLDTILHDHKATAEKAGYKVHRGEEDAGDLKGRYWWTCTADGRADIESSPEVFDEEEAAWLDAIFNHFDHLKESKSVKAAAPN